MSNYKITTHSNAKTGGYGEYSINSCIGCTHGCVYCYAPATVRRTKESFHQSMVLKREWEERLEYDCLKLEKEGFKGRILLSHVTDPYQPEESELKITRKIITMLNNHNINFQVLTKGGTRACRDFDLYKPGDSFAVTITTMDENKAKAWEPLAANPVDRVNALIEACNAGIETWVSMEPVICPNDSLDIIKACLPYTGHFKIGPINHNKELQKKVDWVKFSNDVTVLIKDRKPFYFNKSMQRILDKSTAR